MIEKIREKVEASRSRLKGFEEDLLGVEKDLARLSDQQAEVSEAQEVARKAAIIVQDDLAAKLSKIVTKAIQTVFADGTEMVAQFVERRGVSECDLFVKIDGKPRDILRSDGGGLADVTSICLQLSYLLLSNSARILIADEACRHMDKAAQERFGQVLKYLSEEFGFTIILVTHAEPLAEVADRLFKISKPGRVSEVEVMR